MNLRVVVGIGVLAAIAVAILPHVIQGSAKPLHEHASVRLVVSVYRDGSQVYHVCQNGDIILKNFAEAIINTMLMGNHDPDDSDKMRNTNGGFLRVTDICESCTAQIVLGSNGGKPSPLDYVIPNPIVTFNIQDADAEVVGNDVVLVIVGSYTLEKDANVSDVGLESNVVTNGRGYVLLFHDVLPHTLHLKAGDTIAVQYYVYFDNP